MKGRYICKHDCTYAREVSFGRIEQINFRAGDFIIRYSGDNFEVPNHNGLLKISNENLECDFEQYYSEEELEYWLRFEQTAAKDILASISKTFVSMEPEYLKKGVQLSIDMAEMLVEELKKRENCTC